MFKYTSVLGLVMNPLPSNGQTKIKIRHYLASPTDASFFANRCSSEDVRVGDVYLKKILGHDADNLGIPVNYFDLTGKLGWYGARCKYAFFVPAVVTKLSMDGFEYKSIEGLLTPDLGVSVSRIVEAIKNGQCLDGLLLHTTEKGEFELFIDKNYLIFRSREKPVKNFLSSNPS